MKFTILLFLLFCLGSGSLFAQNNYFIKGVAADSVAHIKLKNTTVVILNAKDSILRKFTRAEENGSYSIGNLGKGKFILLLSYPGYADYVDNFTLDSVKTSHDFGTINMRLKSRILQEVIIKGTAAAIKIKGDTTEFNAAAYKIEPNSRVEDLLKQLPGIEVDKDGKITAQGQTVSKVLVDGEEFFGDDPTLVTKNIRGDMVDKVQLYDKKSDQAAFTGIDDGQKTKTINIKLKDDKKNGMFGKADAGDGPGGYYQSQLIFNAFRAKQKFSVYGTMGNNSRVGLGWEDNQKYGTGQGLDFGDGTGGISFNFGGGDDLDSFDGRYNGQGIPLARTAGVHYDSKWNNDKESINTNYKIGSITIDGTENDLTQNNQPDNIFNSRLDQTFHKYMFRQKLDAVYQIKLDTSSNLKISVDGTVKHSINKSSYSGEESRNDTLINKSTRDLINNVDQRAFNASAFYTHKFKKVGRTLSFSIVEGYSQSKAKGNLNSTIKFYNAQKQLDTTQKPQIIDQYKTNDLKNNALNTNLTYSEPFSKTFAIVMNYGISVDNTSADRQSFNASSPGVYNVLVDSLSSNYKLNQFSNQAGAIFNYKKGKTILNFGTRVVDVNFHQVDESGLNAPIDRNFVNWAPQASYQYRFSNQKSFRISYNGSTTQPTLDQIQPLKVNNDPLNEVIGNPTLSPSFTNSFNINYNSYKVLTSQFIGFYGNYSFITNPIVTNTNTDLTTGKSTSQAINLTGKTTASYYFGANLNKKIEAIDMNAGLNLNANGNVYYNYANDALNRTVSYTYNPRFSVSKYKEKKFDFYLSAGPTYTISQSSLQIATNNNGGGFKADAGFNIYLPGKFQIGSDDNYEYTAKTQSFSTDFKRTLINAYIIKKFMKSESLSLELWGNDLLNQNVGFNRNANGNLITQNSYTTIKRYFMFTIAYDFTRMGGGVPKK